MLLKYKVGQNALGVSLFYFTPPSFVFFLPRNIYHEGLLALLEVLAMSLLDDEYLTYVRFKLRSVSGRKVFTGDIFTKNHPRFPHTPQTQLRKIKYPFFL